MKKTILLKALFVLFSGLNIWGQINDASLLASVSKILIIPTLGVLVMTEGKPSKQFLIALFFSWLGDCFLIPQGNGYFIAGILSFWVTQIMYCRLMLSSLKRSLWAQLSLKKTMLPCLLLFLYLIGMLSTILPALGSLKVPVMLYAITLTLTGYLGISCALEFKSKTTYSLALGCLLFVISDSMIAFDAFYFADKTFGFWIMATYVPAQYLISRHLARP